MDSIKISKKLLIPSLGLYLVALSTFATESDIQPKTKKRYYNPYFVLVGRSVLNAAGAALCSMALEKCATYTTRTAVDLGHIASAVYWIGQESEALQKFQREKETWNTIQRCNEVIKKWNQYCHDLSKKYAHA